MLFEYETLKLIWWGFAVLLLVGFAVTDGFDLGVAMLLPWLARSDDERRVLINCIAPHWEGNQVWFITAGGALFAAWPFVYAAAFSGLYVALLLVLLALILRPVGFEFRSKVADARWRALWDWALFTGGALPALIFGVAVGNLLLGLPFHFEGDFLPVYTGSFWQLLTPFPLLVGVISVLMLLLHGAIYAQLRAEPPLAQRAMRAAALAGSVLPILFLGAGLWVFVDIDGYRYYSLADPNGVVTPFDKAVHLSTGAWYENYTLHPLLFAVPAAAVLAQWGATWLSQRQRPGAALVASGIGIAAVILTPALAMFPFILPSRTQPDHSLTAWDAVSSPLTLTIMFWAVVFLLPIVLAYTAWAFRVMRGTIGESDIRARGHELY
jgi:cytochrome bd ubiquinol oxidase subunit II